MHPSIEQPSGPFTVLPRTTPGLAGGRGWTRQPFFVIDGGEAEAPRVGWDRWPCRAADEACRGEPFQWCGSWGGFLGWETVIVGRNGHEARLVGVGDSVVCLR